MNMANAVYGLVGSAGLFFVLGKIPGKIMCLLIPSMAL